MAKMTLAWSIRGGFDSKKVESPAGVNSAGKPFGGIWLSPITKTGSEWTDFCRKEEMDSFLRNNVLYHVQVERKGLYGFRTMPTKKKMEKILQDDAYRGFYVKNVYSSWDVPTVWVKSLEDIEFLLEEAFAV